jgi:F-type H+-transporting ATPase subunit a
MAEFWQQSLWGNTLHLNTLIMVWVGMGLILVTGKLLAANLQVIPNRLQVVGEGVYDFCRSITMATAGPRGDSYLFFIGSLFLFILMANVLGQLPLKLIHLPQGHLMAATGDINTTAALAVMTVVMCFVVGIRKKGLRYFKHYIQPSPLFLPLNIVEDFTRPGSLMIRLYFNILVGEILSSIAMSVTPFVLPVFVIFLELFVAVVQAYIFSILSAVYVGMLSDDHH